MATIKDIAKEAGVSVMTVSNVINNRTEKVSQKTIDNINAIIKRVHYTPNMLARSLVLNSSKVIAYINTIDLGISDPFNAAFIDALERSLSREGYYLMIKTISSPKELKSFLQNWNLDGMVFVGIFNPKIVNVVAESKLPAVFIDSYFSCKNAVNIGLNDYQGSFNACEYLISKGHRKIAVTAQSSFEIGVNKARLSGFKDAMQKHGVPVSENLLFDTCNNSENAMLISETLVNANASAVFAFSDYTAIEIMRALTESGKKIPDDISVMGFDDISLCRLSTPQLTTVHQDTYKKGKIAVEKLIEILNGSHNVENVTLPTYIVERDSVKQV